MQLEQKKAKAQNLKIQRKEAKTDGAARNY